MAFLLSTTFSSSISLFSCLLSALKLLVRHPGSPSRKQSHDSRKDKLLHPGDESVRDTNTRHDSRLRLFETVQHRLALHWLYVAVFILDLTLHNSDILPSLLWKITRNEAKRETSRRFASALIESEV